MCLIAFIATCLNFNTTPVDLAYDDSFAPPRFFYEAQSINGVLFAVNPESEKDVVG